MDLTNEFKVILNQAFKEAKTRNHEYVTPEHVLYASLNTGEINNMFMTFGIAKVMYIREDLERFLSDDYIPKYSERKDPVISESLNQIILDCYSLSINTSLKEVEFKFFLFTLILAPENFGSYFIQKHGISREDVLHHILDDKNQENAEILLKNSEMLTKEDNLDRSLKRMLNHYDSEQLVKEIINPEDIIDFFTAPPEIPGTSKEQIDKEAAMFKDEMDKCVQAYEKTRKMYAEKNIDFDYNVLNNIRVIKFDRLSKKDLEQSRKKKKEKSGDEQFLLHYSEELVSKAREGRFDPVIEREEIIGRTFQVLARRNKSNPLFVGEPGVGKTAVVQGLAQKIANGQAPEFLQNSEIYSLSLLSLIAGTSYRGDFEERINKFVGILQKKENAILFIDEIHTIIRAGAVEGGSMDLSNILKPVLTNGKMTVIGSTTYAEYKQYFIKDRTLSRRFQKIDIPEPDIKQTVRILKGICGKFEQYHHVKYTEEALKTAVDLSSKFISESHLPDKAIDIIDEAGASVRSSIINTRRKKKSIRKTDIEKTVSKIARIPEKNIAIKEKDKLYHIDDSLKKIIFGQNEAVSEVGKLIKQSRAGMREENKPVCSLLFVGPTGVGKTELSKQLAAFLNIEFIRFDMSEYQEKYTLSRLLGASPGYVGYGEGGQLSEQIKKHPYAVLLLDEIEKAHPDIYNVLLQIMDYATLTESGGEKIDFRNIILIMTSNAGSRDLNGTGVGFNSSEQNENRSGLLKAVENTFTPEFRNRLDSIVTFNRMTPETTKQIIIKKINHLKDLLKKKKVRLEISQSAVDELTRMSFSTNYGAREAERIVDTNIKKILTEEILFGDLQNGGKVIIGWNKEKQFFLEIL